MAALPTVAYTSEFRDEQVQRLVAIREGSRPPEFPRVEHGSPDTYRRYSERDTPSVWAASRATNAALIAPSMAIGMAHYSLVCTQATLGQTEAAVKSLGLAVASNPDLVAHARSEPDLAALREHGRLAAVLA
jgi:hypothetical protein